MLRCRATFFTGQNNLAQALSKQYAFGLHLYTIQIGKSC